MALGDSLHQKFGPLPMYEFAPMNTAPQLIAARINGRFAARAPKLSPSAASVANVT